MDYKSAYYDSYDEAIVKSDINPESIEAAAPAVQGAEEMFFAWTIFLIS